MYKFLLIALLALTSMTGVSEASNLQRIFRDVRLPTQSVMEHQTITAPAAAGTTNVLSINPGNTSASAAAVTTFVAQPDVPRNLVVTPVSTTANVQNCTVAIVGTDFFSRAISENLHFNTSSAVAGTTAQAFKTVTSITFPASCEASPYEVRWNVGYGELLGLKRCMDKNAYVFSNVDGTYETTRATIAYDTDEVSKNTADFNGTMNSSAVFDIYFVQDFNASCQP